MTPTPADKLPPLPEPTNLRRQVQPNGGYCLVPAYTKQEMHTYAQAAVTAALAAVPAQGVPDEDALTVAYMAGAHEERKRRSPATMAPEGWKLVPVGERSESEPTQG